MGYFKVLGVKKGISVESLIRLGMLRGPLLMVIAVTTAAALGVLRATENSQNGEPSERPQIQREGTRLDQKALRLRAENDRLVVQIEPETTVQVLENLASQRVYRANQDDPEDNRWSISGFFTEFEGQNYLFIEKAVRIR